jgi:alkylation response protein AidB-like acyl-CoA dehydrogenase
MSSELQAVVEAVATEVAAKSALQVDQGQFPTASLEALRRKGLLGLISAVEVGGRGEGPASAVLVVERLARECASSAMVLAMHYAGTSVLEKVGPLEVRRQVAAGKHLTTLAFSEAGSRSQFWAPVSSAKTVGDEVALDARKSWVTSAHNADSYVWSSRPLAGKEASTLWLMPRSTPGLRVEGAFDGLGLRGNDSAPVTAEDARLPASARLGGDGEGFGLMMGTVLPWFNLLNAACGVGLMEAATTRTIQHASGTRFEHWGSAVAELPTARAFIARMRVRTDQARALLGEAVAAVSGARPDAMLRVLEVKASAGEAATEVTDWGMRVCGGAAFRKEVGVERAFRDARAGTVMAPTTDALYDFIGKAVCGLPLF